MNHLDNLVHDWGWPNRAYTRLLIRSRGYRLVSMLKTLPSVDTVSELPRHENGALLRLEPRQSLHDLQPPVVALGEHADYVVDYYKREFAPREDRPFIAWFRNPVLYGRQFSILDSRCHAFEECFTRDRRWREGVPKHRKQSAPKKVSGTWLLAGTEFHNHYAHLFCDVLPRLKLFEETGLAGRYPNILPPKSHAFADDAIRLLGLEENGSVRWDDGCWQLDGLYFASSFKKFCSWTPESAAWVRAKLAPELTHWPVGKKVFYISRSGPRSILNEEEIVRSLQSHDVTVVQAEKLTLREQIDLFAGAGLIVGPHGAGIQNALWAPHGCPVLEFVNARYFSGIYWTLAASLNQPYGLVTGMSAAGQDPLREGYACDPRLVCQAVDRLRRAN
ncbi:MAG TPA: glycosyltransferase family 61 protein [Candidatus Methylacidiphilales bacterium]|jgi:hypothetical protein|nr:glycosyltransferase family 61 protein [Candidatus Methylacidiphilales bacterium]